MSWDFERQSADLWLSKAEHPETLGKSETPGLCVSMAQTHALLALGAALIEIRDEIARLPS